MKKKIVVRYIIASDIAAREFSGVNPAWNADIRDENKISRRKLACDFHNPTLGGMPRYVKKKWKAKLLLFLGWGLG